MDATTRKIIKEIKIDCLIIWGIFVLFAIFIFIILPFCVID